MNKHFIITIDTEGDNLWAVKDVDKPISTENAKYLFRFQELCEKYSMIPTYLVNYEMAKDNVMRELGRDGIRKKTLEIGAHEHAWNTPPYYPLIKRPGKRGKPYISEYPKRIIQEKLRYLTSVLEDSFGVKMLSHRGGRWCFNQVVGKELCRLGYIADCTCTPGVSWKNDLGWSPLSKGTDWSMYANKPFWIMDEENMKKKILEIPVSIASIKNNNHYSWLRPTLSNNREMKALLDHIYASDNDYAEFMLHSSEMMPGGSPIFSNAGKIEQLFRNMEDLFEHAKELGYVGISLSGYAKMYTKRSWNL